VADLKIRVDEEMHGWLKTESSRRDVSINALVNEVLAEARKMQIRGKRLVEDAFARKLQSATYRELLQASDLMWKDDIGTCHFVTAVSDDKFAVWADNCLDIDAIQYFSSRDEAEEYALYSWPDEDELVEPQEFHLVLYEANNQNAWRISTNLAEVEDGHKVVGSITVDLLRLTGLDKGEADAQIALKIADKIGLDLSDPKSWNEV
jgi:hypothetical protein